MIFATWLPVLLAQWLTWTMLGTSDLDVQTLAIVAVALAFGQGVAARMKPRTPLPTPAGDES